MTAGAVTHSVLIDFWNRIYMCNFQALPLLLYGCESCLLTLRQYHTWRVFEESIEESILIQESGSNRRMERSDLYAVSQLYSTPALNTIVRTRLIGCAGMGRNYKCTQNFSRKTEGKKRIVRPRHGWEDSVKHTLKSKTWMWAGFIWLKMQISGGLLCTLD